MALYFCVRIVVRGGAEIAPRARWSKPHTMTCSFLKQSEGIYNEQNITLKTQLLLSSQKIAGTELFRVRSRNISPTSNWEMLVTYP